MKTKKVAYYIDFVFFSSLVLDFKAQLVRRTIGKLSTVRFSLFFFFFTSLFNI